MSSPAAPWTRIYNDVKMHIPGLTDAVFKQVLYSVMDDFLSNTNIWTEEVPIAIEPNTFTYPFTVSHKGDIKRLMLVYDPAVARPDRQWVQGGVQMTKPGVLETRYAPAAATTWNAVVAKVLGEPVDGAGYPDMEEADHWIVDQYGDGVVSGIIGRLMAMPAKPYTSASLAKSYWQDYIAERSKARGDVTKANVYGGQRWQYPQSFATVRRGGWV